MFHVPGFDINQPLEIAGHGNQEVTYQEKMRKAEKKVKEKALGTDKKRKKIVEHGVNFLSGIDFMNTRVTQQLRTMRGGGIKERQVVESD